MSCKYITKVSELSVQEIEATRPFHRGKKNKIKFLGHLVFIHKLFSIKEHASGQICTTNIARGLGVSGQTVCNWIKDLIRLKWLVCTDPTYKTGKKSKSYTCTSSILRELYFTRFPSGSAEKGLKKSKLIEKRRAAWKKHSKTLLKLEEQVQASETSETTVKQRQKAYKGYVAISKLYLGQPFDMMRDMDKFLKGKTLNTTHREMFYMANKNLCRFLKIKKKFTRKMFLNIREQQYTKIGKMFTGPAHLLTF
jgi:hypothetical protein